MSSFSETARRLWYLLNRRRIERELQLEMTTHREMMSEPARFGNDLRLRERSRDVWGWTWVDDFGRDLRLAARSLRRTPAFTTIAIVSLVLGLSLAAGVASVANSYLIRSLPYPEADRLYHVMYAPPGPYEPGGMQAIEWTTLRDVVEYPITAGSLGFYLGDHLDDQSLRVLRVNPGFVKGLGVRVVVGRALGDADFASDAEPAVMIGYGVWRDRFGGDSSVIGRIIHVAMNDQGDMQPVRVVGVMSPGFWFGPESSWLVDALVPLNEPARAYMVRLQRGVP
ncbi:MAG: ABC transporter permease, partial [Gemmatimonadaceae bacterium]